MKVGDIVRWRNDPADGGWMIGSGLIIQLSRTGHDSHSALILYEDGCLHWMPTEGLETINESR